MQIKLKSKIEPSAFVRLDKLLSDRPRYAVALIEEDDGDIYLAFRNNKDYSLICITPTTVCGCVYIPDLACIEDRLFKLHPGTVKFTEGVE
jgi:hypothetical protein